MRISETDPADLPAVAAATDVLEAARQADHPWTHPFTVASVQGAYRYAHDGEPVHVLTGEVDGRVVAVGELQASDWDNLDAAWLNVVVQPGHRRRGLGAAMLAALEEAAAARGRTKLGGAAWDGTPGVRFAEAHGYVARSRSVLRRQHLNDAVLAEADRLHAVAAAAAADYEVLRLPGLSPDHLLEDLARVAATVNDAPLDDLDLEPDTFDPRRVRGYEECTARRDRSLYRVVARHRAGGGLAGLSALVVERERPDIAYQHDTTVAPEHRGHRLGLLLKTEMVRWLAEAEPGVRTVDTWNAESNEPMVAVNEALGYRWTARQIQFQR